MKEGLSNEEAYIYVIEMNMIQRFFTDMAPSEKAAVGGKISEKAAKAIRAV